MEIPFDLLGEPREVITGNFSDLSSQLEETPIKYYRHKEFITTLK